MAKFNDKFLPILFISIFGLMTYGTSVDLYCPNGEIESVHNLTWVYNYPDDTEESNRCIRVTPHYTSNKEIQTIEIEISNYSLSSSNLTIFYGYWPSEKNMITSIDGDGPTLRYVVNDSSYFIYYQTEVVNNYFTIKHSADTSDTKIKFSLNLFIGTTIAILIPYPFLIISKCFLRKRFSKKNEDGTKRRINFKTPKQEQILIWISISIGLLIMILFCLGVFG